MADKVASKRQESVKPREGGSSTEAPSVSPPLTRGAFRKGALLAALLIIPGLGALLHRLAHDPLALSMEFAEVFATVSVFAGLPSLLVFGGIGKNLARQRQQSLRAMMLRGALLGALAAISLGLLAAVPTATWPSTTRSALLMLVGAACIGALAGCLLGLWILVARRKRSVAGASSEA